MPCDTTNTATLTITGNPTDGYNASPNPVTIPLHGCIIVDPPAGGCVLCLSSDFDGRGRRIPLDRERRFGPMASLAGTTWTYTVQPPGTDPCPAQAADSAGHTIQVGNTGTH